MSTKIEFEWKPGELESVTTRKIKNGFTVHVRVAGDYYGYAFADFPGALELISECFCWDMVPAAEPAPQKFPATFRRIDMVGPELRAVFVESGAQWSRNAKELDERMEWLRVHENLTGEELGQWHAVLAELRARMASGVKAEPASQKFPATFKRFYVCDGQIWASFIDKTGLAWARNEKDLAARIQWLRINENLVAEELAKWDALLVELRTRAAWVAEAAKS